MRLLSKELNQDINKVETTLVDLQVKLKPVTLMNDTVGLCKSNINQAVSKMQNTVKQISLAEETLKALRRKEMINQEYELYSHHMNTAHTFLTNGSL